MTRMTVANQPKYSPLRSIRLLQTLWLMESSGLYLGVTVFTVSLSCTEALCSLLPTLSISVLLAESIPTHTWCLFSAHLPKVKVQNWRASWTLLWQRWSRASFRGGAAHCKCTSLYMHEATKAGCYVSPVCGHSGNI